MRRKLTVSAENLKVLTEVEAGNVVGATQQHISYCIWCATSAFSLCPTPTYIPDECYTNESCPNPPLTMPDGGCITDPKMCEFGPPCVE